MTEELTAVALMAWLTVWVTSVEAQVLKLPSPLYATLMVWLPTLSELVLNVA